jgi:hypothetical protein
MTDTALLSADAHSVHNSFGAAAEKATSVAIDLARSLTCDNAATRRVPCQTAARELASERMPHFDDRFSTLLALLMLAT